MLIDARSSAPATTGFPRPGCRRSTRLSEARPGLAALIDTRNYSNGPHELELLVTDALGSQTFIGKRQIIINNPRP